MNINDLLNNQKDFKVNRKSLGNIMNFGKMDRCTVKEVIDNDIEYMMWLIKEKKIDLDNEAYLYYERAAPVYPDKKAVDFKFPWEE